MKWAYRVLTGLGAAAMLVAVWLASYSLLLILNGTRATGEIVDFRGERRAPVIQFRAGPRIVRGQLEPAGSSPAYRKGGRVPLYYAIATPERFVAAGFDRMWMRPLAAFCAALALWAAAWLVRLSMRGVPEPAIFGLAFQGIGAALLAAAAILCVAQWLELRSSLHTVGTIVNGQGAPWRLFKTASVAPLPAEIAFTTTAGRREKAVDARIDARHEAPNAAAHVFYDPEYPEQARVAAFGALWFNAILLALLGLAAAGAGWGARLVFRTGPAPG